MLSVASPGVLGHFYVRQSARQPLQAAIAPTSATVRIDEEGTANPPPTSSTPIHATLVILLL